MTFFGIIESLILERIYTIKHHFQCFQGSRGERVAATSCHPPLQTFTVSSLPILSFRAPWLVGGCPNDLSLDWGARRIEAPRG